MIGLWFALVHGLGAPAFVESRLEFPGQVLGYECPDVNDDERGDLFVVTREDGVRILNLFLADAAGGFADEPTWRLSLPADVSAYGLYDARTEPGLEVLLFSARGVFSLSPTRSGLKDNLKREIEIAVFPALADPDSVRRWPFVTDVDGDGADELLVPTKVELAVFRAPRADGSAAFTRCGTIRAAPGDATIQSRTRARFGKRTDVKVDPSLMRLFEGAVSSVPRFEQLRYLQYVDSVKIPALFDWNGDGRADAIPSFDGKEIEVYEQGSDGAFATEPTRVALALEDHEDARIRFVDIDGDGRRELVVEREDGDGLSRDHVFSAFARGADGAIAAEASGRVKLNASDVRWSLIDVDRDTRDDLVARVVDLPLGITDLASVRLELKLLVFRGLGDGGWSRKPDFTFERRLEPAQMERIRESFVLDLGGDFDGDGLNDLLSMQPDGLLEITTLQRDGEGFRLASSTLTQHRPANPVRDATPVELSHDGIADLVLRHESALTVFVSRRGGA